MDEPGTDGSNSDPANVVRVVEATGAAILILGGFAALVLGLDVLIVGDIVRTIIVHPTITSVAVLGMVVIIRIILSFSPEVEIDGVWPWSRWRLAAADDPAHQDRTEPA